MAKLYKQYCYDTLNDVKNSIESGVTFNGGLITSVIEFDPDLTINYTLNSVSTSFVFTPPTCTYLGFDNSYTGISISDAYDLSWLISAVLIIAFSITVLKRGL